MNDPRPPASPLARFGVYLGDLVAVLRLHIVLVAVFGSLVFGWLMTGRYLWWIGVVVALDWFLINLLNRITDLAEDLKNGIRGTAGVARRRSLVTGLSFAALFGSLIALHLVWPALTPWRVSVHLIGLGYNFKLVPTPRGLSRFKELYFFKNTMSAVIFLHTCFAYPLALAGAEARTLPWPAVATLMIFFFLFELTYEVLYDLRDLEGDRAEGVPTYPVVHGDATAVRIIDGLLAGAALALVVGLARGWLGVREGLMLFAPALQFFFYRARLSRGLTPRDCIVLTDLGSAQLVLFLVGTALWQRAGLPENIFVVSR